MLNIYFYSFSFIVTLFYLLIHLNIFKMNQDTTDVFYFLVFYSLIGAIVLVTLKPNLVYGRLNGINGINMQPIFWNLLIILIHLIPFIYYTKNKENTKSKINKTVVLKSLPVLLIYFILFYNYLPKIYEFNQTNIFTIGIMIFIICYIYNYFKLGDQL